MYLVRIQPGLDSREVRNALGSRLLKTTEPSELWGLWDCSPPVLAKFTLFKSGSGSGQMMTSLLACPTKIYDTPDGPDISKAFEMMPRYSQVSSAASGSDFFFKRNSCLKTNPSPLHIGGKSFLKKELFLFSSFLISTKYF